MTNHRHLADATLVVLARRPQREPRAREADHLAQCTQCRAMLAHFRMLRDALLDPVPGPDRAVLAAVLSLAENPPSERRDGRRVPAARLLRDTGPVLMASGIRSGSGTREQLWRIPGADVDIRIEPAGLGSPGALHGQLFPLEGGEGALADGGVWLFQRGRRAAWSPLGEDGEFELPAPSVPRWTLWLEWRGVRARLEVQ